MLVAFALIGLGVYLNLRGDGDGSESAVRSREAESGEPGSQAPAKRNPRATIAKLRVEPALVELGAVTTCAPPREFECTIFNDGSGPALVQGWASSCGCLVPAIDGSIDLAPGASRRVRVSLEPWGIGERRQTLALRLEGGVPGPEIEVVYRIEAPVWPRPAMVNRPEGRSVRVVDLERSAPNGSFLAEPFEVLAVVPLIADIGPSLGDGHASIAVDFDRIDALASDPVLARDAGFTWREDRGETRWKTLDLRVRTSVESCPELVIRVRNR
jgi:hypothetical protein